MESLPPKVQERLNQLSARFREGLPAVLEELAGLRQRCEDGETAALRELRMRVHRIAGSASTFGFELITQTARAAEQAIERDLATDGQRLTDESQQALNRITQTVREAVTPAPAAAPVGDPLTAERPEVANGSDDAIAAKHRLVIVTGPIPGATDDISDQLAVFGLTLVRVDEIAEVETLLHRESAVDGPHYDYTVLLSTVDFVAAGNGRLRDLTSLRNRYPGRFLTVLVGDEDDFDTRLRSVRYGADAFLALPFDTTALVDHLEKMMGNQETAPYHILIVDDDPEQVSTTALQLQQAGMITSVVTDPRNIFRVLVEYKPELILLDMYMPDCSGAELASIIRQNDSFVGIPIVFLSVETDSERQFDAIRSGADDFLTKPIDPEHLVTSVRIRAARTRAMRFFMERDSLTGLLNHTNLKERLEDDLSRARRIGTRMVFAMIDIDHFKSVNDTYGHLTGDRVLKGLARLLEERLRRTDVVGRYGGEEFGIILFNTDGVQAKRLMDGLRESFSRLRQTNGEATFTVTFSCGIAEFPRFESASSVSEAADAALYLAKEAGRNRVMVAEPPSGDDETAQSS